MSGRSPRWFTGIQYPWEANFADNTWAQIIEVCQKGIVPATWKVGDQKAMTIDGADYLVDIIGLAHDDYADGSGKAPITFQLHDCYATEYKMNDTRTNDGGWTASLMRTTHLPAILALMPSKVQAAVREISKLTSAGAKSETINTTADKLFLLSEIEVFGTAENSFPGEGTQYNYYAIGGTAIKALDGSANAWFFRSPRSSDATRFVSISTSGEARYSYANAERGVSFGFCF